MVLEFYKENLEMIFRDDRFGSRNFDQLPYAYKPSTFRDATLNPKLDLI